MARTKKFFHAVWSGYLLTISVSVLSFITIPIALAILGKSQFGLWTAVAQVAAVAMILDMGMGPSLARFLADFKDNRESHAYADFFKTVLFAGLIQAALFSLVMLALLPHLPAIMNVSKEQTSTFKTLLIWQLGPLALGFMLRPFGQLLYANQHIAIANGCNLASTGANMGVLVAGLGAGWGLYAYIAAAWAGFIVQHASVLFYVFRLKLLPHCQQGRISLQAIKPLLGFSGDVLLIALGLRLIYFAPTLLITRHFGVASLSDWTIGTRLIQLVAQITDRIPNASEPVFWEMFARKEFAQLRERWCELVLLASVSAAFLAAGVTAINPLFIQIWTSSLIHWETAADIGLTIWLVGLIASNCVNMTPGITKQLGKMKFVYLLEGAVLTSLAYIPGLSLRSHWQVALAMLLCLSLFRVPYGLVRTCQGLEISATRLAKIFGRVFGVTVLLLMLSLGLRKATFSAGSISQCIISGIAYVLLAGPIVFCLGFPAAFRKQIRQRLESLFTRQTIKLAEPPHKDAHNGPQ